MEKLVCIGGGEVPRIKNWIQLPYETKEIDEEIVRLSGKQNPKLLFIGTASTNSYDYICGWWKHKIYAWKMERVRCR